MPVFSRSVLVHAPLQTVFGFHERADALEILSPSFPPLRVIRKSGGIESGGRVELQIGPVRWVALHTQFQKNAFFEDRQISGPFAEWVHRHEFVPVGEETRLTDRVEFRLPGGAWVNRLFGWCVQLGLQQMFRQRHRKTRLWCERKPISGEPDASR